MSGVRVLVGTRKGAFILTSDEKREKWDVCGPVFAGWEMYHLKGSPVNTAACAFLIVFACLASVGSACAERSPGPVSHDVSCAVDDADALPPAESILALAPPHTKDSAPLVHGKSPPSRQILDEVFRPPQAR